MKAIETEYKGYRFRSRLEARWAVFFDALRLPWEYEPEGFDLGEAGAYLPDFRIKDRNGVTVWYEVKPESVLHDEKLTAFAEALSASNAKKFETDGYIPALAEHAYLLSGDPMRMFFERPHRTGLFLCPRCASPIDGAPDYDASPGVWVYCGACDASTPCGGGHPTEIGALSAVTPHKGHLIVSDWAWGRLVFRLRRAAQKARGARFEHGEKPHHGS